jgi:hypothetical protein
MNIDEHEIKKDAEDNSVKEMTEIVKQIADRCEILRREHPDRKSFKFMMRFSIEPTDRE